MIKNSINQYHPDLKIETLCISKKGRDVELFRIHKNSAPDYKTFLLHPLRYLFANASGNDGLCPERAFSIAQGNALWFKCHINSPERARSIIRAMSTDGTLHYHITPFQGLLGVVACK